MLLELIRQLPFLFFVRKRISNRLLTNCRQTLQPDGSGFRC
jgi:hypothetical protein